jgi:endo-alpha-1,4-polygalactosaminidase (GH114 family)
VTQRGVSIVLVALLAACAGEVPATQTDGASGSANNGGATAGASSSKAGSPSGGGTSNVAGNTSDGGISPDNGGTSSGGSNKGGDPMVGPAGQNTGGTATTGDYWKPKSGLTWQWQLSEDVATPLKVDVYDIDWEADKAIVDELHAAGIKVICYVSVGSWEDYRPDAGDFPPEVIGNDYTGWPGEKYVDIRADGLRKIMSARFDICRSKGFDAIEPDNQDVFEIGSDSGFPLTKSDGIAYAKWLADEAHSRGLGIGQKNAASITSSIVSIYDWVLTESCYSDGNWCGDVEAYAKADKPVFMCEYEAGSFDASCSAWQSKGYSPILKGMDLDAPVTFCK